MTRQTRLRRWAHKALALISIAVPSVSEAADTCGVAEAVRGGVRFGLLSKQEHKQEARVFYLHLDVASSDDKLAFFVGYQANDDGVIEPHYWSIKTYVDANLSSELAGQRVKWKFANTDWTVSGFVARPDVVSNAKATYEFKAAQSGQFAFNNDSLKQLHRGGRVDLARLDLNGRELAAGVVNYPNPAIVRSLYDEAKARAIETMSPCEPPVILRPAPIN